MILYNIPPGLTTTIQLKARTVGSDTPGSNVGTPISGSSSGSTYTYSLGSYATGDYWAVLSGVSDPAGSAFPVRDDKAYPYSRWETIVNTLVDNVLVANVIQPTAVKDRLVDPIIIGDDYLASVGRNFEWQVNAISGYAAGDLSCRWGGKNDGVGWLVSGTVTTITGGISLKFDLPKTATSSLTAGYYAWSVEVFTTVGGIEVTRVVGKQPVQLVEKQT
jgi:hypothetical protein